MFVTHKKKLMAFGVLSAILTLGSLSGPGQLLAQVKYALVRDTDSPGRGAFQTGLDLSLSGTSGSGISIPSGKRLVIDYISVSASGPPAGTQPFVTIYTTLGSGPAVAYTLTPTQSPLATQQFQDSEKVQIYGDTLFVGLAYSGTPPFFLQAHVSLSGHLIDMP